MKRRTMWRRWLGLGFITGIYLQSLFSAKAGETWQFRGPNVESYVTDQSPVGLQGAQPAESIEVYPAGKPDYRMDLLKRIVVRVKEAKELAGVVGQSGLQISKRIDDRTVILEATDAWAAARQASQLAALSTVEVCTPIFRRPFALHGSYAARTDDPYLPNQWHLENRDANGAPGGADINIRAAWPLAKGEGVTVAVADEGVQLTHPDLAARATNSLHHNFHNDSSDGNPMNLNANYHGTAVAGLITADTDNGVGIAGTAPLASLASWVIFNGSEQIASDDKLAEMFDFETDQVAVQNHSWGGLANIQVEPSFLEQIAIDDAYNNGRGGKGVVIVRAGTNHRLSKGNVNDDAYASSPEAIAVGAVRLDGRVASYSSRGCSLLISAPSGDTGFATLFTTDLVGSQGYNQISFIGDQNNYAFGSVGFSGTSGSTPEICGIVALMLSANPNLKVRDVQHILVQSARHYDLADPSVQTNGAGFLTSDNVGFGVPDASVAVKLAQTWSNVPPVTSVSYDHITGISIPEAATRLKVLGPSVPGSIQSIQAYPTDDGPRVDKAMSGAIPIVNVGDAVAPISEDLHGKAALVVRGGSTFASKITNAASAGATFVVIYDNTTSSSPLYMDVDDFSPIPAVFISQAAGQALTNYLAEQPTATTLLSVDQAAITFNVPDTLLCEHVGVKVTTDHHFRSDLRVTLISPSGTVSRLQGLNNASGYGPTNWTFYSTQNFYEPSCGQWTVQVTDEIGDFAGLFTEAQITIRGIAITDTDHDGLDDNWEMTHFGNLDMGPKDDPDGDGWQNAREQVRGTDPNAADEPFKQDLSVWNANLARLSWPGAVGQSFSVQKYSTLDAAPVTLTNVAGKFPVTETFVPRTNLTQGFYLIKKN